MAIAAILMLQGGVPLGAMSSRRPDRLSPPPARPQLGSAGPLDPQPPGLDAGGVAAKGGQPAGVPAGQQHRTVAVRSRRLVGGEAWQRPAQSLEDASPRHRCRPGRASPGHAAATRCPVVARAMVSGPKGTACSSVTAPSRPSSSPASRVLARALRRTGQLFQWGAGVPGMLARTVGLPHPAPSSSARSLPATRASPARVLRIAASTACIAASRSA